MNPLYTRLMLILFENGSFDPNRSVASAERGDARYTRCPSRASTRCPPSAFDSVPVVQWLVSAPRRRLLVWWSRLMRGHTMNRMFLIAVCGALFVPVRVFPAI